MINNELVTTILQKKYLNAANKSGPKSLLNATRNGQNCRNLHQRQFLAIG
jgi:hypothetical protein